MKWVQEGSDRGKSNACKSRITQPILVTTPLVTTLALCCYGEQFFGFYKGFHATDMALEMPGHRAMRQKSPKSKFKLAILAG